MVSLLLILMPKLLTLPHFLNSSYSGHMPVPVQPKMYFILLGSKIKFSCDVMNSEQNAGICRKLLAAGYLSKGHRLT